MLNALYLFRQFFVTIQGFKDRFASMTQRNTVEYNLAIIRVLAVTHCPPPKAYFHR